MAKEREVKVVILGEDKGASRALNKVDDAAGRLGPSGKIAENALQGITSRLTAGLGPASGEAQAALDKMGASALGSAGILKTAMVGGVAVAGAALAAFAVGGAQKFVELAGEVRNFQRASGASAEDSSRFVAVLDDMGISSEVGSKAIFKLNREIGEGGKNLAKYGVEVARTKDGTVDATGTLLNLADAYTRTNDPGERAAMVMSTLGKSGQALIPVLEQGREGLKSFFEGAEKGNQIFNQEDLDKARKYELALDDLSDTYRGLQMEAGEALLPFLIQLAEGGTKVLEFTGKIRGLFKGVGEGLSLNPFGELFESLGLVKGRMDEAKPSSDSLKQSTKEMKEEALEAARASDEQAKALDRLIEATVRTLSSDLAYEQATNRLRDAVLDLDDKESALSVAIRDHGAASKEAESANRTLRDAHIGIKDAALNAAGAAVRLADDTATASGASLTAEERARIFRAKLYELADQAGASRGAIRDLADSIRNIPDKTVRINYLIVDQIQASAIPKGKRFNYKEYAKGGIVDGPTMALIGEAGRELVLPLTNMRRTQWLLERAGLLRPLSAPGGVSAADSSRPIHEDDPRWDWRTMGNKMGGSMTRGGGFGADDWYPDPGERWEWNGSKWELMSMGNPGPATAHIDGRSMRWKGGPGNPWETYHEGDESEPPRGGDTFIFNIAGHVMTERELADVVQTALLQKQRRVPSLGLA